MRTFWILALLIWILGSSFFTKKYFCPADKTKKPAAAAAGAVGVATDDGCDRSLLFEDRDFSVSLPFNIKFKGSSANIILHDDKASEYESVFKEVAQYLEDNPERSLLLEGVYFEKEINNTDEETLGDARAKNMKHYLSSEYDIDDTQLMSSPHHSRDLECAYDREAKEVLRGIVASFGEKI